MKPDMGCYCMHPLIVISYKNITVPHDFMNETHYTSNISVFSFRDNINIIVLNNNIPGLNSIVGLSKSEAEAELFTEIIGYQVRVKCHLPRI